jgi:hypothetical protein
MTKKEVSSYFRQSIGAVHSRHHTALYELQNDMSVKELMRLWSERPGRFLYKDKATVTSTKPLVVKEIPPPSSSHSLKNSVSVYDSIDGTLQLISIFSTAILSPL